MTLEPMIGSALAKQALPQVRMAVCKTFDSASQAPRAAHLAARRALEQARLGGRSPTEPAHLVSSIPWSGAWLRQAGSAIARSAASPFREIDSSQQLRSRAACALGGAGWARLRLQFIISHLPVSCVMPVSAPAAPARSSLRLGCIARRLRR